jgi:hypothetical protein
LILPLLVQKELKYLTFVANGIINQPIHDPARDTTGTLGFGFGRAITRHTAAMVEVRYTSTLDLQRERRLAVNYGLMRRIRDNVVLYVNVGRSVLSDEGIRHNYVGVGVKFLLRPNYAAEKKWAGTEHLCRIQPRRYQNGFIMASIFVAFRTLCRYGNALQLLRIIGKRARPFSCEAASGKWFGGNIW